MAILIINMLSGCSGLLMSDRGSYILSTLMTTILYIYPTFISETVSKLTQLG